MSALGSLLFTRLWIVLDGLDICGRACLTLFSMKWLGKGRTVHWILNLFLGLSSLCILPAVAQDEVSGVSGSSVMGLVKFQKDSSAAGAFSFESKEQALDTLIV